MRLDETSDENPKSKISIAIPKTDFELCATVGQSGIGRASDDRNIDAQRAIFLQPMTQLLL
jgi:hypothetical protein